MIKWIIPIVIIMLLTIVFFKGANKNKSLQEIQDENEEQASYLRQRERDSKFYKRR